MSLRNSGISHECACSNRAIETSVLLLYSAEHPRWQDMGKKQGNLHVIRPSRKQNPAPGQAVLSLEVPYGLTASTGRGELRSKQHGDFSVWCKFPTVPLQSKGRSSREIPHLRGPQFVHSSQQPRMPCHFMALQHLDHF